VDSMKVTSESGIREQPQSPPAGSQITPAMLRYLKQTKSWVRFISLMIFIGTVLVFLLGLVLILGAGLLSSLSRDVFGGAPLGLLGFVYTVFACLSFFPALYLSRFAGGIKKALSKDEAGGIEDALKNQRAFWRYMGIFLLIILVLQIVAVLILVYFAVGFGARR
jgi:hypothetical protein